MKAGHKFLLGAALIIGSVGFLIAEGVKETGVYFLTPAELAAKTASDPTFVENIATPGMYATCATSTSDAVNRATPNRRQYINASSNNLPTGGTKRV